MTKQNSRVSWNNFSDLKIRFHYLNLHLIPQHCLNWRWDFSYVIIIIYVQWFLKWLKLPENVIKKWHLRPFITNILLLHRQYYHIRSIRLFFPSLLGSLYRPKKQAFIYLILTLLFRSAPYESYFSISNSKGNVKP